MEAFVYSFIPVNATPRTQCRRNAAVAFACTSGRTSLTWKTAALFSALQLVHGISGRCTVVSGNSKDAAGIVGSSSRPVYFTFSWLPPRLLGYVSSIFGAWTMLPFSFASARVLPCLAFADLATISLSLFPTLVNNTRSRWKPSKYSQYF